MELRALTGPVVVLARRAGAAILGHYRQGLAVETKADGSPVTIADRAAEKIILAGLATLTPDIPVVAEEAFARSATPLASAEPLASAKPPAKPGPAKPGPAAPARYWLVDPLDGTKEFLRRNDHFTVNIALIRDRRPVLGVVHAPALGATYWTPAPGRAVVADGAGRPGAISARAAPAAGLTVVGSRAHGRGAKFEAYLARHKVARRLTMGSAIKFCLIARGLADLYPRFGPTMEWDTAAGQAVLTAAGGRVETVDGAALGYGKPGFKNPPFIARGRD